jgi:hypothetical protein
MAADSLLPEQMLLVSPSLAAAVGLEQAVLLQFLQGAARHRGGRAQPDGRVWCSIPLVALHEALPFWDVAEIERQSQGLAGSGLIALAAVSDGETLTFTLNDRCSTAPETALTDTTPAAGMQTPAPPATSPLPWQAPLRHAGGRALPPAWRPGAELIALLQRLHGIPEAFAQEQVEDFVLYWCERGEASHAWENKFRQHVLSRWRRAQQDASERFTSEPPPLDRNWYPSEDALEILIRSGVSRSFVDDAVPEFILYWRERGESPKTLNSRFIQHIRRQWARFTAAIAQDGDPAPIAANWRPSADVYDILGLCHIDTDFAEALLPTFILYWRDRGQAHASWNTKFLQHVKFQWANRHELPRGGRDETQQGSGGTGSTRNRSLADDLGDRSWAT